MKKILIILFVTIPVIILPNLFGTISALVKENGTLLLSAPKGTVIDEILFASYGTPVGYPNKHVKYKYDYSTKHLNNFAVGNCHSVNSKEIISKLAIGKRTVEIKATNSIFGDPCGGTIKRLFVTASFTSVAEFGLSKANGICKSYFQGKLIEEGSYKMGKKEGLWKFYAPLTLQFYFFDENQENPEKFYINDFKSDFGGLVEESNYQEGRKLGLSMCYYRDKLISKGSYKDHKRTGPWEFFDEGELSEKGSYKQGNKTRVWQYYVSNKIYKKITHNKENKNDAIEIYQKNGNLLSKGKINKKGWDNQTGLWEVYNRNGKLSYKGEYQDGSKIGDWLFYDENKKVIGKINYKITGEENVNYNGIPNLADKSNIYITSKENRFETYNEIKSGKNYRIIDFKDNYPVYNDDFKKKNDDITITNENWGSIEIKFHKKVKLVMVDFYDQGCGKPFTTFNFKNINKKKTISHYTNSLETLNIIFNESELLNDMKFFEIQHCEGFTYRIMIIYR